MARATSLPLAILILVAACTPSPGGTGPIAGGAQADQYAGTYAGSFSGSPDAKNLTRNGTVEFSIDGDQVRGGFTTGLGRRIAFTGDFGGKLGLALGVRPESGSGCTDVAGSYSDVAFPPTPLGAGFSGTLACAEFNARWTARRIGPSLVSAGRGTFSFVVPPELPPATVGAPYRYSFCKPESSSARDCGSVGGTTLNSPSGGSQPYTFQKEIGASLPWGLGLQSNGVLEGTPDEVHFTRIDARAGARFEITVCAVDSTRSYRCASTSLRVLPPLAVAVASPTARAATSPTAVPVTPTPTRAPVVTAPASSRRYTGSVTLSATYSRTDSDFGTHQVQAMAVLPIDVDFASGSQSARRTANISGSYSISPKPVCGGSAGSGSVSGSVQYYVSGGVDAARGRVTFLIAVTSSSSSPNWGACFTTTTLLLFTSGALDSSGNSFTFDLGGGESTKSGVLTFHESRSVKTSYSVVARLSRVP